MPSLKQKADFFAFEELLDDSLLCGFAGERAGEEAVRGIECHGAGIADEDSLARGETVGFDDNGRRWK